MTYVSLTRRSLLAGAVAAGAAVRRSPAAAAGPGQTLIVAADTEPRNLNPAIVASNGVFYVASKVIEPLAEMGYGGDGLVAAARDAWEGSPDGRAIRFTLREGVTWHDGKPVHLGGRRVLGAAGLEAAAEPRARGVQGSLEAVETPDAHTAIFRFSQPTPFQLIRNALPALTAVAAAPPLRGHRHQRQPGEHEARRHGAVPLRRAPAGRVLPARAQPGLLGERAARSSTASSTTCCPTAARSRRRSRRTRSSSPPSRPCRSPTSSGSARSRDQGRSPEGYEGITYQLTVEINHRRKELADARVRRAIAHAIDRTFVVDTIFLGYAKASTGPIPHFDKQFYAADAAAAPSIRRRANALLDEAGYPARRERHALPAAAAAGALVRADAPVRRLPAPGAARGRHRRADRQQRCGRPHQGRLHRPRLRPRHRLAGLPQRSGDLDDDPLPGRPAGRRAVLEPVRLRQPRDERAHRQGGGRDRSAPSARALPASSRQLAAEDLPLIHVAEFTFITVARDSVRNVANNPRWATSHWADTWLVAPEHPSRLARHATARPIYRPAPRAPCRPFSSSSLGAFRSARARAGRRGRRLSRRRPAATRASRADLRQRFGLDGDARRSAWLRFYAGLAQRRSRHVGRVQPAGRRRDSRAPADDAAPDGRRCGLRGAGRLALGLARRRAARRLARPRHHRSRRWRSSPCRTSGWRFCSSCCFGVRLALVADRRAAEPRRAAARDWRAASTSPGTWCCRPWRSGAGYLALYAAHAARRHGRDLARRARARGARPRAARSGRSSGAAVARPALLPVVVLLGQQAGTLFGGSVVDRDRVRHPRPRDASPTRRSPAATRCCSSASCSPAPAW